MQLNHRFTVPADIDRVWSALNDLELVAGCMPGAKVTSIEGDHFEGQVKVRVGPMQLTYRGEGELVERDDQAKRIVIDGAGKEDRGQGRARATIRATLTEEGDGTAVEVVTDLDLTGKPAQFGRGALAGIGEKLLDLFSNELANRLGADGPGASSAGTGSTGTGSAGPEDVSAADTARATTSDGEDDEDDESLDLLDLAGGAMGKKFGSLAAGLAAAGGLGWWAKKKR